MTSTSFPSSRVVFFGGRHVSVDVRYESFARYSEDRREAKKVRKKEFIYVRCIFAVVFLYGHRYLDDLATVSRSIS